MNELKEENIVTCLLLTIFTFGIYYFFWQYRQMKACNILLNDERHGLFKWLILSFLTLGLYHFYHEYKMSGDLIELQEKYEIKANGPEFPILCLVISIFGFFLVVDIIHQEELNKIVRKINGSANTPLPTRGT